MVDTLPRLSLSSACVAFTAHYDRMLWARVAESDQWTPAIDGNQWALDDLARAVFAMITYAVVTLRVETHGEV